MVSIECGEADLVSESNKEQNLKEDDSIKHDS
jgi:hypothetical protein